jgi:hypothetical protein
MLLRGFQLTLFPLESPPATPINGIAFLKIKQVIMKLIHIYTFSENILRLFKFSKSSTIVEDMKSK